MVFLPLYDGAPMRYLRRPVVNYALIALNIAIFALMQAGVFGDEERLDLALGTVPSVLLEHNTLAKGLGLIPEPFTLVTSLFVHGSWEHVLGNMLFLWVFGDNVEDALGSARYLAFYLLCGVTGAIVYALADQTSDAPLVGASGAISGVVAAYLMLYPHIKIFGLALNLVPLKLPAMWCMGAWIVSQVISALASEQSDVAFWAHVGGVACGLALTPFLHRAATPLWSARET